MWMVCIEHRVRKGSLKTLILNGSVEKDGVGKKSRQRGQRKTRRALGP